MPYDSRDNKHYDYRQNYNYEPLNDFQNNYDNYYRQNRQSYNYRRSSKKYKLFPITLAGVLVYSLSIILLGFIWSIFAFTLIKEPEDTAYIAYIIYFLSLCAGCCTAAFVCRGTSIFPAAFTAFFALLSSLLISGFEDFYLLGFILKLVLSLIVVLLINICAKAIGRKENRDINIRNELRF